LNAGTWQVIYNTSYYKHAWESHDVAEFVVKVANATFCSRITFKFIIIAEEIKK